MIATTLLIVLAMAVLGATTGFLIGMSSSPVVGIAIPIIMGLAGGTGGFHFMKSDTGSEAGQYKIRLASLAILVLSLGLLGGVWQGIGVRTTVQPWSLLALETGDGFPPRDIAPDDMLEWVLLDARLFSLGLGQTERRRFFSRLAGHEAPFTAEQLRERAAALLALLRSATPPPGTVQFESEWRDAQTLFSDVLAMLDSAGAGQPPAGLPETLDKANAQLTLLDDDDSDREYLAANPQATAALSELRAGTGSLSRDLGASLSPVHAMNASLDRFLGNAEELTRLGQQYRKLANDGEAEFVPDA